MRETLSKVFSYIASDSANLAPGEDKVERWCRSNATQSPLFADEQVLGDEKVAPHAKGGIAFLFEPYSGADVPFKVEVIVH